MNFNGHLSRKKPFRSPASRLFDSFSSEATLWVRGCSYALPIRNTLVPQTGQVPFVAGLPFFSVTCDGLRTSRLLLHFMQYASMAASRVCDGHILAKYYWNRKVRKTRLLARMPPQPARSKPRQRPPTATAGFAPRFREAPIGEPGHDHW